MQVDRFVASRAVALVLQGVPGIYLPSMIGSRNDVEAVYRDGSHRSINRTGIDEDRLFKILADEDAVSTRIAHAFLHLLQVRTAEASFHPAAPQQVLDIDNRLFCVMRSELEGQWRVLCLINVSSDQVPVSLDTETVGFASGELTDLVTGISAHPSSGRIEFEMAPYAVCWLKGSARDV
jgi:sucrose phosphorylase